MSLNQFDEGGIRVYTHYVFLSGKQGIMEKGQIGMSQENRECRDHRSVP